MSKSICQFLLLVFCLSLILMFGDSASAQRRRGTAPKKPAVENVSDEEKAATLENLQGAKIFQLLAQLQLGLAEAYVGDRAAGELQANVALTKIMVERLKKPASLYTLYGDGRARAIWIDYYLDRTGLGRDEKTDRDIKDYNERMRRDVEDGLQVNPNSPYMLALRGNQREMDCRLNLKSSAEDCYSLPLADLSRAIALKPDESEFFSRRAEFLERRKETTLAEKDNQSANSIGDALGLKLELDKKATKREPFYIERANADFLYFIKIVSLLQQDENIKTELRKDAATLKSFRETLLEYYALADASFAKAGMNKPLAENLERRGALRYHLALFAQELGFEQPAEYARKTYEEAIIFYTGAIKFDAKFAGAYQSRARVYRKLGKTDLAEADEKQFDLLKGK